LWCKKVLILERYFSEVFKADSKGRVWVINRLPTIRKSLTELASWVFSETTSCRNHNNLQRLGRIGKIKARPNAQVVFENVRKRLKTFENI